MHIMFLVMLNVPKTLAIVILIGTTPAEPKSMSN